MLWKIYRELMILGFIGFTFIMAKERGLQATPAFIHCFEFCDLMVTNVVFLYTLSTAVSSFFMHVSRRQWDRYMLASTEQVCRKLDVYFTKVDSSRFWKARHWLSNRLDHGWRDEADFKMCELLFKQQFHLDRTFDYNLYVMLVLEEIVVNMANISPYHWCVVCCFSYGLSLFATEVLTTIEEVQSQTESVAEWGPDVPDLYNPGAESPYENDAQGGDRRRLGGSAAPVLCEAHIPCVREEHISEFIGGLFDGVAGDGANETPLGLYNLSCAKCVGATVDLPTTALAIFGFAFFGWCLLWAQGLLLWLVGHRTGKIAKYHGAKHARYLPTLLRHLERHLLVHTGKTVLDVGPEEEEEEDGAHDVMMVFHHAGKTANNLMSVRTFTLWMNWTKMIMLLDCFYFGFYICHIQFRVDMAYADDWSLRMSVHAAMLFPCLVLVFVVFPKTSRRLSLLLGILHLQHEAVTGVGQRMELVLQLRGRIRDRLKGARFFNGEPQIDKGQNLLKVMNEGDTEILKKLDRLDSEETQRKVAHSVPSVANKEQWSHHHEDESPEQERVLSVVKIQRVYLRYKIWCVLSPPILTTILTTILIRAPPMISCASHSRDPPQAAEVRGKTIRRTMVIPPHELVHLAFKFDGKRTIDFSGAASRSPIEANFATNFETNFAAWNCHSWLLLQSQQQKQPPKTLLYSWPATLSAWH